MNNNKRDELKEKSDSAQEIDKLKKQNERLREWVSKSHHADGCKHRYGKNCDCGKFSIEALAEYETKGE